MEQGIQRLEGAVEHLIYENEGSGYTVFEMSTTQEELVVVAGTIGQVNVGETVTVYGNFTSHPTYGDQFRAETCEVSLPQDAQATLAYLSSGALPYIGPATAKKMIEAYGAEALDVIANTPEQLTAFRGISLEKAKVISQTFKQMFGVREAVAWLGRFGIQARQAVDAFRHFGPSTVEALSHNPYLLCGEPLHLRFAQVDAIAAELQMAQDGQLRIWAALGYVLRHNAGNGHTCLPRARLVQTTAQFIGLPQERIQQELDNAIQEGEYRSRVFDAVEYIYLPDLLSAEEDIAWRLADLVRYPAPQPKNLSRSIDALEIGQGFHYAPLQRQAIELALKSNIMVLTGGPGTGKTTTVNAILALFESQADRVALCAPTGRAAKRLSELTGHKASTIHRLLEVDYTQKDGGPMRFLHNEKNLLKCDVVVLDEMSMVDVRLFQSLLSALKRGCRMVLVGDADQLPSVGPGNILGEVVRSGVVPTVCLTRIFRQAAESLIVSNAHRIVEGQMPQKGGKTDDFFLMESGGTACQQLICDLVCTRLPKSYGYDPIRDIQVLCPTKIGPTGTTALNQRLQEMLNPPSPQKPQLEAAGKVFRMGDKVMQVRNNYDIPYEKDGGEAGVGAFNGDMGIVTEVMPAQRALKVQMDDHLVSYSGDALQELEIAYAVTVHKSQGSEFPAVILPVADVPEKLCYRNLLYTGVTRARQLCVLTGRSGVVASMVKNVRQNLRYSGLSWLLVQQKECPDL